VTKEISDKSREFYITFVFTKTNMAAQTEGFQVVIKGIQIPADVAKRLEVEIRQVVLKELASLDLKGDYVVSNLQKQNEPTASLPGGHGTRGIVVISQY
jgi:hypothetical protein